LRWPERVPVYHIRIPVQLELFDDDVFGEFHESQTGYSIGVSPEIPQEEKDLTLAHEILHAWLRLSGLVRLIGDHEETICDGLAPLLCQLIGEYQDGEDW